MLAPIVARSFPRHKADLDALLDRGFEPRFWDVGEGWLLYLAASPRALAYVHVEAERTTTRVMALAKMVGVMLTEEPDGDTLTLQVEPPVGVLAVRATEAQARARLLDLFHVLQRHIDPR